MRAVTAALALSLLVVSVAAAKGIVGTDGPDRLVGTPRADTLSGGGGNDTLVGGGGSDLLLTGPGKDVVDAGRGADLVSVEYDGSRDRVTCGQGVDTVTADPADRVAADCELVARRLSRDPYTNPESQHETEVEPHSFTFGSTTVAVFQVARRLDGGAANIGFATSRDGGRTWANGFLPGLTELSSPPGQSARASDPVVAYDAAHGVWLASALALSPDATRLTINRSTDGESWSDATVAAEERAPSDVAFDKNWIACDNGRTSPFFGHCYLAYTHSTDRDMLALTTTDDGGTTWSEPVDADVRPAVGALPVIRPNGDLVLLYLLETQPSAISASRSTDGGHSFEPPVPIAEVSPSSRCGIPGLRMFPLPSGDADAQGRITVAWQDCPGGQATSAVYVSTSTDGVSWEAPARVTSGSSTALPAVGVDPASGRVAIAYLRMKPTGIVVELVQSLTRGTGWSAPRRLSVLPMPLAWMPNTTSGRMLGDYFAVHYAGGHPLVVWVLASKPVGTTLRQAVYATRG